MEGRIHSFESLAAVDGEGLRYGVFFCGCPLRCAYCHNPDTWEGAGTRYTPQALAEKIARYKPYFKENGGVTFSGGEPLLQAPFLCEVLPLLKEKGVRYAVDTSGAVPLTEQVKTVLLGAQTVLLDLKFATEEGYRAYAKGSLAPVLSTLSFLMEHGINTVVRTVVVPRLNDSEEALSPYLALLQAAGFTGKYELLAFHTMGFHKYEKMGAVNPLLGTPALSPERLTELQAFVNEKLKGE